MVKLKRELESLEGVDEKYHELYEEKEGKFVLAGVDLGDVEGKLSDFREQNKTLHSQLQGLREEMEGYKNRFKGIDPEKYRKAQEALSRIEADEEKALIAEGKIDEVVERRIERMKQDFESQIKAKSDAYESAIEERDLHREALSRIRIDDAVLAGIEKAGFKLRPGAKRDALSRGREVWRMNEKSELTPDAGGKVLYGKNGNPISMDEFVGDLLQTASHLFESGEGGGAEGGGREAGGGSKIRVSRRDGTAIAKYHKELGTGEAVFVD